MDKQLSELEENRVELILAYSGRLNEKDVASTVMVALRKADEDCFVILAPTSSSTVKELERELRTVTAEYEYAMKLLCEATGQVYSENNVTISAKQVLNNL